MVSALSNVRNLPYLTSLFNIYLLTSCVTNNKLLVKNLDANFLMLIVLYSIKTSGIFQKKSEFSLKSVLTAKVGYKCLTPYVPCNISLYRGCFSHVLEEKCRRIFGYMTMKLVMKTALILTTKNPSVMWMFYLLQVWKHTRSW